VTRQAWRRADTVDAGEYVKAQGMSVRGKPSALRGLARFELRKNG